MKVYRIEFDVNHYQYFLPENAEDWKRLEMDCTPKVGVWEPPVVFILEPLHIRGDFYQFGGGFLIMSTRATEVLEGFLAMAGELLPLPQGGQEFTILNVLECINCLDHEATEWFVNEATGEKYRPKKYAFNPNHFTSSMLFKIPETCRAEILVVEGRGHCLDEEFRYVVEQAGLKGLLFKEIWSDET